MGSRHRLDRNHIDRLVYRRQLVGRRSDQYDRRLRRHEHSLWEEIDVAGAQSAGLYVANFDTGALTIKGGGDVHSTYGYISNWAGSTGTVTASTSASWIISNFLYVGRSGTGDLLVRDGSVVRSTYGYIGFDPNSTGTVTVEGATSTWTNTADLRHRA